MTLVLVASESREFSGLLRHAAQVERLAWPLQFARKAELGRRAVVMVAHGPGPKLAARAAEEAAVRVETVDGFVSIGYCGALDAELKTGSIVVASEMNGQAISQPASDLPFTTGPVLSQDAVACTVQQKSELRRGGAIAVEMEAAGIASVARRRAVPFYCVRVVTDAASDALALDFNQVRDRNGRFSRSRILAAACRQPGIVPELMKFQKTSKRASLALGDFIANCRF